MTVINFTGHHWIGSVKIPAWMGQGLVKPFMSLHLRNDWLLIVYWVGKSIVARDAAFGMP